MLRSKIIQLSFPFPSLLPTLSLNLTLFLLLSLSLSSSLSSLPYPIILLLSPSLTLSFAYSLSLSLSLSLSPLALSPFLTTLNGPRATDDRRRTDKRMTSKKKYESSVFVSESWMIPPPTQKRKLFSFWMKFRRWKKNKWELCSMKIENGYKIFLASKQKTWLTQIKWNRSHFYGKLFRMRKDLKIKERK